MFQLVKNCFVLADDNKKHKLITWKQEQERSDAELTAITTGHAQGDAL
jgi:methylglyoxal synthase